MKYTQPLEQFSQTVVATPDANYLHQPINRQLKTWTWREVDQHARSIAGSLLNMNLDEGARVGILSKNCAEWIIADLAIMMAGMISVPIYPTANREIIGHIIIDSGCQVVFIGRLDATEEAENGLNGKVTRIIFPYPSDMINKNDDKQLQWQDLLETDPLKVLPTQNPNKIMSIVYTSGSTGKPKGVVLTCNNFASAAQETVKLNDFNSDDRLLSYLPLAHITERGLVEITSIYAGWQLYFIGSLSTFVDDLKAANPSLFISVPRLWNKFQSGVLAKMPDKRLQFLLKIPMINKLVARKIRKGLGFETARVFGSGSAPISPAILHWFNRLDVPISEGWGMTETTGLCCSNLPFRENSIGTIGRPMQCVEMKLGENQEIMIRGDAVFTDYYNNPSATEESFTDGWFHTGDMGEITNNGDYKIIGRVKEQFKSAKGKYVTPALIENLLGRYTEIEQVCVMGAGRKQPIALVVMSPQTKSRSDETHSQLLETLEHCNSKLEAHQRLDHLIVLQEDWTIENNLLTPTLKIKRTAIENKFEHFMYKELTDQIFWEDQPIQ